MKTKLNLFQDRTFCAVARGIGLSSRLGAAAADSADTAPAKSSAAIPWSRIGAKAGADYQGDGLAVIPIAEGARLRCAFQRLEGEATRECLWLTSTVTNAVSDRFRIVAAAVGRAASEDAGSPGSADLQSAVSRVFNPQTDHSIQRARTGHALPIANRRYSRLEICATSDGSLPPTGTVAIDGQSVRFSRAGMVEEYTVSMDGVRQDFIIEQRPAGTGELALRLAVSGAKVEPAASGAQLVLQNSGRKIAYSRLRATDATGKELPARMEVMGSTAAPAVPVNASLTGGTGAEVFNEGVEQDTRSACASMLAVLVNDADAVYPIRIDPTFSDANWIRMNPSIPGADRQVIATVVDGSGNLYIGGNFTVVGDVIANRIAKWNGSSWSALGSGIGSYVYALVVSGSDLYAGGSFTTATNSGGVSVGANRIAKWNGSSWSALGSGMNDTVRTLAVSGSDLYAGGDFTTAGGSAANSIAKWDGGSWSALDSGMNGPVSALAVLGSDLYSGGDFTNAGGSAANRIAKWDGSSWTALGSGVVSTIS